MRLRNVCIATAAACLALALSGCANVDNRATPAAQNHSSPEVVRQVDDFISSTLSACIGNKTQHGSASEREIFFNCIKGAMTNSTYAFRKEFFSRPISWQMAAYSNIELYVFLGSVAALFVFMLLGYKFNMILLHNKYLRDYRHRHYGGVHRISSSGEYRADRL